MQLLEAIEKKQLPQLQGLSNSATAEPVFIGIWSGMIWNEQFERNVGEIDIPKTLAKKHNFQPK